MAHVRLQCHLDIENICYVHVPQELRTKLDAKSEKCVFVGYSLEQKGYRCYNPSTRELKVSRDVVFDELSSWYIESKTLQVEEFEDSQVPQRHEKPQESIELSGPSISSPSTSTKAVNPWSGKLKENEADTKESTNKMKGKIEEEDQLWIERPSGNEDEEQHNQSRLRRSSRVSYPVQKLTYDSFMANHYAYMSQVIKVEEPSCFEEASKSEKWKDAMDEEMEALVDNKTWVLVPKGVTQKPIGCKWVFKVKHNSDGSVARYKARLVAKGFAQTYGIDYEETFSPVAKMTTIRTLLAVAAAKSWKLYQLDVKNAFLNGDLLEEIYMEQPQGYVHPKFPTYICKLKKALYGLKQAPRAWYHKLVVYLMQNGFRESDADPSLFVNEKKGKLVAICIYVDDLIVTGNDDENIKDVKRKLKSEFKISDLGELKYFLGIEIVKKEDKLCLSQRKYLLDVLKKFGMSACKPLQIPLDVNAKFTCDDGEKIKDSQLYRSIIGSLIYATITRPDIVHTVGVLSQFMQEPTINHLKAAKRILRYIKGTINYGLIYDYDANLDPKGYCDADWAGSPNDRRSISGYVFMIGTKTISWSSKKQPTVALSSTEAEYRSLANATCEVMWLKKLLGDLHISYGDFILCSDSMSAIYLAKNPVFHARSKHIEVHYHFIREKVITKEILLLHVKTGDQVADIFTKFLDSEKLKKFMCQMNIKDISFRA